jgi:hypothetical protein
MSDRQERATSFIKAHARIRAWCSGAVHRRARFHTDLQGIAVDGVEVVEQWSVGEVQAGVGNIGNGSIVLTTQVAKTNKNDKKCENKREYMSS